MEESSVSKNVRSFFANQTYNFSISKEDLDKIFSSDPKTAQKSTAIFFDDINRTLRKHCISISEYITMMKQYGFISALLSAWEKFSTSLILLSSQISKIFGDHQIRDIRVPGDLIIQQVRNRILHFGYKNWKKYVLDQSVIAVELPSCIQLIGEVADQHHLPYTEKVDVIKLINLLPDDNFEERDYFLANIISTYFHFFSKHPQLYPEKITSDIKECSMLADTLYVYMRYNKELFILLKEELIQIISKINQFLVSFHPTVPDYYPLFDNDEYISLLKMICLCMPEEYIKTYIPGQIRSFPKLPANLKNDDILDFFTYQMFPLYERASSIIEGNINAIRTFSKIFCLKFFPLETATKLFSKLFNEKSLPHLRTIWKMTEHLPQYVIALSDAFITYYKISINEKIKERNEEKLQEEVAIINGLVDNEFHHHPTLVLARSTIFIPHQKDSQLVGRARVLLEQAHNPSKKNYSIAELFDIVPFVKNKRDLFKGIAAFLQNQLLSQIDPNVELERTLIDSMGQYTERDYIYPLQEMLKEFASRYDDYQKIQQSTNYQIPREIKIAVLSNTRWKHIVQRGILPFFEEFRPYREFFEKEFYKIKKNSSLIWCDYASVIEVELNINGRSDLFLFNGAQYGIVRLILNGNNDYNTITKYFKDDSLLQEQLSTLIDTGLVKPIPSQPNSYYIATKIDERLNRNFAKKFTSAENIAIIQMKELDRRNAISTMIVSEVKKAGPSGIHMKNIVHNVKKNSIKFFALSSDDIIREQARKLEITKYIKLKENSDDMFIFNP